MGLKEAFDQFKTDLFMSSLRESSSYPVLDNDSALMHVAIAMPMGNPESKNRDRQSIRQSIEQVLNRSETSFTAALEISASSGSVENVRQACLSLALLRAFQTSLGHGSYDLTAAAACILGM